MCTLFHQQSTGANSPPSLCVVAADAPLSARALCTDHRAAIGAPPRESQRAPRRRLVTTDHCERWRSVLAGEAIAPAAALPGRPNDRHAARSVMEPPGNAPRFGVGHRDLGRRRAGHADARQRAAAPPSPSRERFIAVLCRSAFYIYAVNSGAHPFQAVQTMFAANYV